MIVIDTVASEEFPMLLVAIKVNVVAERTAVGVPVIAQVVGFTLSVPGRAVVPPLISQPVIADPLLLSAVGVMLMAVPAVPVVPVAPE